MPKAEQIDLRKGGLDFQFGLWRLLLTIHAVSKEAYPVTPRGLFDGLA
jgi:hypothetical protein